MSWFRYPTLIPVEGKGKIKPTRPAFPSSPTPSPPHSGGPNPSPPLPSPPPPPNPTPPLHPLYDKIPAQNGCAEAEFRSLEAEVGGEGGGLEGNPQQEKKNTGLSGSTEPNHRTEPNRTEPNRTEPNRTPTSPSNILPTLTIEHAP